MKKRATPETDPGVEKDRLISKDYLLIIVSNLGVTCMNQFFLAVTPLFIELLGGAQLQTGMMTAAFAIAAMAARPVSGVLSDKFGRVRQMIIGTFLCAVVCAVFGFIGVFPVLLVLRAINGASFGMHSTSAGAAVADVIPTSRLAEGIGYYGLISTISLSVAPGIALYVVRGNTMPDFRTLFLITSALCFAGTIISCCITYERKKKKAASLEAGYNASISGGAVGADAIDRSASLPKAFLGFEYAVFAPALVVILVYAGQTGILAFMALFARSKGIDNPAMYYIINGAGIFVSRVFFGRVVDRRGPDVVIIPAMSLLCVCLILFPFVDSLVMLAAIGFPIGLSIGSIVTTLSALVFKRSSAARRGTASGAYFGAIDLSWAISTPLLGAVADAFGYEVMYRVGAAAVLSALIVYLLLCSEKHYNAKRLKEG